MMDQESYTALKVEVIFFEKIDIVTESEELPGA